MYDDGGVLMEGPVEVELHFLAEVVYNILVSAIIFDGHAIQLYLGAEVVVLSYT